MTEPVPEFYSVPGTEAIHKAPARQGGEFTFPFTPQQLLQIGAELIEQFLRRVVNALAGVFIPGLDAFTQLQNWGNDVGEFIGNIFDTIADALNDLLGAIFGGVNFLDLPTPGEFWSSAVSMFNPGTIGQNLVNGLQGALSALDDWITDIIIGIGNALDDIPMVGRNLEAALLRLFNVRQKTNQNTDALYRGFSGDTAANVTPTQAEEAASGAAATIAAHAAAIAALQQEQGEEVNAGFSELISFTGLSNTAELPASFTTTYEGDSWTGTWGIYNGATAWVNGILPDEGQAIRVARSIYNVSPTTTDYQKVGMLCKSVPTTKELVGGNHIIARANAANTTRVEARFSRSDVQLWAVVAGVETQLGSTVAHVFKANNSYYLECGTVGGLRVYRVLDNDTPLLSLTDASNITQVGASYRYAGIGSRYAYNDPFLGGPYLGAPGAVTHVLIQDNTPATFVGSTARFYRASTTGVSHSGTTKWANNFLDTVDHATADYTWEPGSNNRITVNSKGRYAVVVAERTSANAYHRPLLYKGSGAGAATVVRAGNGPTSAQFAQSTFLINLEAGDYIQPGTDTGGAAQSLIGSADGAQAYIEIMKL